MSEHEQIVEGLKTCTADLVKVGVKELIIRTGDAPEIIPPTTAEIHGEIEAPLIFIKNRTPDQKLAAVTYTDDNIQYVEDFTNKLSPVIYGRFKDNSELNDFRINGNPWNIADLTKFIKFNKRFFEDRDVALVNDLLFKLQNFEAKINTELSNADDRRANIKKVLEKTTDTDLPHFFILSMNLFGNSSLASRFQVNIELEPSGDGVMVYLYSEELIETVIAMKKEAIRQVVEKLQANGLTCIKI